jgi:hypothetical protein
MKSAPGFQGRMGRSIHELPKVSPKPGMPNPSTPCGGPPPKWPYGLMALWPYGLMALWPYGHFGGGPPTGWVACSHLLPPWIPHAVRACCFCNFVTLTFDLIKTGRFVFGFCCRHRYSGDRPWACGVGCPKGSKTGAGHPPWGRATPEMTKRLRLRQRA